MKILMTGVSSFTGFWFARVLAERGHEVVAPLRRNPEEYRDVRARRLLEIGRAVDVIPSAPFGSDRFLDLVAADRFDLLALHGAEVGGYSEPDFDVAAAVAANTFNARRVLAAFGNAGGKAVIATGSYFEPDEGNRAPSETCFSPYGLSKSLTYRTFEFWCRHIGIPIGKFVIPNPFGAYQEARLVDYLVRNWRENRAATINKPDYVRDNVHVGPLARVYAEFCEAKTEGHAVIDRTAPSGYVESTADFVRRCARHLGPRLNIDTPVAFGEQTEIDEPLSMRNDARIAWGPQEEEKAWDTLASFYQVALVEA
ncbi:MAG: NAD-dependent epimerase/dehydratase family protein [Thalassobaculum sp.]